MLSPFISSPRGPGIYLERTVPNYAVKKTLREVEGTGAPRSGPTSAAAPSTARLPCRLNAAGVPSTNMSRTMNEL